MRELRITRNSRISAEQKLPLGPQIHNMNANHHGNRLKPHSTTPVYIVRRCSSIVHPSPKLSHLSPICLHILVKPTWCHGRTQSWSHVNAPEEDRRTEHYFRNHRESELKGVQRHLFKQKYKFAWYVMTPERNWPDTLNFFSA